MFNLLHFNYKHIDTWNLGNFSFSHTNASGTFVLGCNEEQTIFQHLAFNVSKILRQVKSVVPKTKILGLKSVDYHLVQQKNSGKIYKLAAHNETNIIKALDEMWKKFGKFSPEKSFTIAALAYDFLEQTITNSAEKGKNTNIS
jgi:hypothetical protein